MKVAIVTDDGTTVSQHFGMARYYAVLTVKGQQVVGREVLCEATQHPIQIDRRAIEPDLTSRTSLAHPVLTSSLGSDTI